MVAWILVLGMLAGSPLRERHRVFVEEEAHFLLSAGERSRFIGLETERARDQFIAAFWSTHDRSEHAERLRACDRLFGTRGRFSQRGRIYQLLGPPSFRESLARAGHRLAPVELWHYTGVSVPFLPDAFYLVYFRPGGSAPYRLWDPVADGVGALVPTAEPRRFDLGAPVEELERLAPELAGAVRELVPGGGVREARSLLASLDAFPELATRERFFRESVRVKASTRRLESHVAATVFTDDAGVAELHYALELPPGASRRFGWRVEGERFRARLTLVGRLMAEAAERQRWEDAIELDVTAHEKESLTATRLSFQGRRIVHPGDDRFELALVADGGGAIVSGNVRAMPLLARELRSAESVRGLPFQVGDVLVIPHAGDIVRERTLFVVSQDAPSAPRGAAVCEVERDGVVRATRMEDLGLLLVHEVALRGASSYRLRITQGTDARSLAFRTGPSTGPAPPTRVIARDRTRAEQGRYRYARARAFTARGDRERALAELELAAALQPDDLATHLELARRRYALGRHREVLDGLAPVAERFPSEVDVWVLMAAAAEARGRLEVATRYYEKAVTLAPHDDAIAAALSRLAR